MTASSAGADLGRGKPSRGEWALFVVCLLALALMGCGTFAQVRLGGEDIPMPRKTTVFQLVCAEAAPLAGEIKAREYIRGFPHVGKTVEDELVAEARLKRHRGDCECAGEGCRQ